MSDIPQARDWLELALQADNPERCHRLIRRALEEMYRRRPKFKVRPEIPSLTTKQKRAAKVLRSRGWSMQRIATRFHTNLGRVSEAINA